MKQPKILIVDDSNVMCQFLALYLSNKYETTACTDSLEALQMVKDGARFDLIVTDLNMPKLNGEQLIQSIHAVHPNVPILVVSASKESRQKLQALKAGAGDFLAKPFHPGELDWRIGKLLTKPVKEKTGRWWEFWHTGRSTQAATAVVEYQ